MSRLVDVDPIILNIQRNLIPGVEEDGTIRVEDAERYFIRLLEEATIEETKLSKQVLYQGEIELNGALAENKKYVEIETFKNMMTFKVEDLFFAEGQTFINFEKVRLALEQAQTVAVEEVNHGEWLPDYETFLDDQEQESDPIQTGWICSLCGRQEIKKEPYCNCGAKMFLSEEKEGN